MDQASLTGVFLEIDDPSRVAECRRIAARIAEREALTDSRASDAAIVVSELATNLLKHAQRGRLQISPLSGRGQPGIEFLSIDSGPGISDLAHSFRDGNSTTGTAGAGLGAVRRLSSDFDVYSQPGKGTVIVSEIFEETAVPPARFRVGVTARPLAGEQVSGDTWAVRIDKDAALLMVADGLGHGILAAGASAAAADAFYTSAEQTPAALLQVVHRALRGTRGAAVAVARVEFGKSRTRFAGLGNVAGTVLTGGNLHSMVSHSGTAGYEARQAREFEYPWAQDGVIVMHSDGLSGLWDLSAFPGLAFRHPSLIAAVLYREAGRDRDDACVIVGKRR
ncbi:MAG TPA: ATP-binding SpoIIE family protein phosphatase [Bryobacteraceae bacterium]|jgi:anti-sigma regulatory factor (Ser/Thr protein kinase)